MIKHFFLLTVLCAIAVLAAPDKAYAYMDPGTGSVILQALAAILVAVGGGWYAFKHRIKSFFNKKKHNDGE